MRNEVEEATRIDIMERLLLIDDDVALCDLVVANLEPEGFGIDAVHNAEEGVRRALTGKYAIILLDIMLPDFSGLDALRSIRARSDAPVLILSARGEQIDRIRDAVYAAERDARFLYNAEKLYKQNREDLFEDLLEQLTLLRTWLPPSDQQGKASELFELVNQRWERIQRFGRRER